MDPKLNSNEVATSQASKIFPVKHPDGVREEILELRNTVETSYLRLAELLSKVRHMEFYRQWGFRTFSDYCGEELGFHERKAEHLIKIWDKVKTFKLEAERIQKIGWTKMRQITPLLTEKNSEDLIHKAEKLSARGLGEEIKSLRPIERTASQVILKLPVDDSGYRLIMDGIEEAKNLKQQSTSLALEMICVEWMEYKGATPELTHLEDHISYLERVYGGKLEYVPDRKDA